MSLKKEIVYRVGIQKKYGFDQNGKLLALDRFVSEGANFVVYSGTLRDLGLFYETAKPSAGYLVTRAAYYDKADKLDFFLQKMIGRDKQIFAKAALAALDAKSLGSFVKIMSHKNQIDNQTMDKIHTILCSDRYTPEVGTLKNILPNLSSKKQATLTPSFSSMFRVEDDYMLSAADRNMVLLDAAKEGVKYLFLILQKRGNIEYFEVFVQRKKLWVKIISKSYPVDFMTIINNNLASYIPQKLLVMLQESDVFRIECD